MLRLCGLACNAMVPGRFGYAAFTMMFQKLQVACTACTTNPLSLSLYIYIYIHVYISSNELHDSQTTGTCALHRIGDSSTVSTKEKLSHRLAASPETDVMEDHQVAGARNRRETHDT